jgi:putative molybdopterin biosynthesis protein
VGRRRHLVGLRQQDLASRVGVSRQSLSVLEAGRSVPSAALALRLARALGCKVEELFWIDDEQSAVTAELAADHAEDAGRPAAAPPSAGGRRQRAATGGVSPAGPARVALASIDGRWVAHRLLAGDAGSFMAAADGLATGGPARAATPTVRVRLLADASAVRDTLLCAGCAPAGGILAARTSVARAGERVLWLERSSGAALELLARGQVHVAGAHLYDEEAAEFNVPFVQRRLPGRSMSIFNLARWEAGLAVAAGNPRRIRGVRDLARPEVSFVRRQAGAAAQDLIERLLRRERLPITLASRPRIVARGHMEVAQLVARGVVDAGVSLAAVARAHGLDFIPLAEERFDLVVAKELCGDARVARLLETLSSRRFRREVESLGGHVVRDAGRLMAETGPTHQPERRSDR